MEIDMERKEVKVEVHQEMEVKRIERKLNR